jgi:hypothetical protein
MHGSGGTALIVRPVARLGRNRLDSGACFMPDTGEDEGRMNVVLYSQPG